MIKNQKIFLNYVEDVKEIIKNALNNEDLIQIEHSIKEAELVVPVVGDFSSGKSTLINSYLDGEVLETGITPVTALATEIRFDANDYIEALNANNNIVKYKLNDSELIKENVKNYEYLRLHLNNQKIKDLEPLILVDMPGFSSPISLHNRAILNYLSKGVYFIVLLSVEDGTITKSLLRELQNIDELGKKFTFCLSKTNLKPKSDVSLILENVKEDLELEFDYTDDIILLNDDSGENFRKIVKSIDYEALFHSLFIEQLKSIYFDIDSSLNIKIATLSNTNEEAQNAINELQNSVKKIIEKKENTIEDVKTKYSSQNIEAIINAITSELAKNQDSLANMALHNPDGLSVEINEILTAKLLSEIKRRLESVSDRVINDFNIEISSSLSDISNFSLDADWVNKLSQNMKTMLKLSQQGLNRLGTLANTKKDNAIYKTIASILGITTTILNPILEIVILFLPEILSMLTKASQEQKIKENFIQKFHAEIIPSIKVKVREVLPEIYNEQVKSLVTQIAQSFERELLQKEQEIQGTLKEKEERIKDGQKEIDRLHSIKNELEDITTKILYKEI